MTENKENKISPRQMALRDKLIDAAIEEIREKGAHTVKARAVTKRAGVATGALYNAFDDIDELTLYVNTRTLRALGAHLRAVGNQSDDDPAAKLHALAQGYLDFSVENRQLWSMLFFFHLPDGETVPEWHQQENAVLIEEIIKPISQLRPDLAGETLALRARTMFAAVHGVIYLAHEGRFVGVPLEKLKSEVAHLVEALTHNATIPQAG